jgi:integrase
MKHRTGYLFKRGDNFYVRWTVNGKTITKALRDDNGQPITTKRAAEDARTKVMAPFTVADEAAGLESIAGQLAGRKAELATLEEQNNPPMPFVRAWSEFLASGARPDTGPDTLAVYEGQFGQFVDWMKEHHPELNALRDVTTAIAQEYASYLSSMVNHGRLTANTYNKHLNMLMLVFRVLYRAAKLTENPWMHPKKGGTIHRKALTTQTRRELTVDDLRKVCQSAPDGEMRTLFALGVYTGLRLLDCATLLWSEVDLKRGTIVRIPHKISRKPNVQPVIVPIHPALQAILEDIRAENQGEYVLPKTAPAYAAGGTSKRRIINAIQDHFATQGVKVYAPGTGPGTGKRAIVQIGFHSLRHTFVSICREANVPLAVVESIVGHHNPAMTRHYTHTGESASRAAVATLPTLIGEATVPEPKRDPEAILREIKAIAESTTEENWRDKKAALIALVRESDPALAGEAGRS